MSTTVRIVPAQRFNKDKKARLYLRFTHNRKVAAAPLNTVVFPDDFDDVNQRIKNKCKLFIRVSDANKYLANKIAAANSLITELSDSGEIDRLTAKDLKNRFINKTTENSLEKFTNKLVYQLEKARRLGNADIYGQTVKWVKKYNKEDIEFSQINYTFLVKLEHWHLSKGNKYNSLSVYMRTLRAIFNKAIKMEVAKKEWYPFDRYKIRNDRTVKRAITREQMRTIENFKTTKGTMHWHAKNMFLFSFYNLGINFTDMARLTPANIVDNRLVYTREKTGRVYSNELFEESYEILNQYLKGKKKDDYIFSVIKKQSKKEEDIRRDIKNGLKQQNKYIQKIQAELEIDTKLTTYVARHSWANIGKVKNVAVPVLSEGLGHQDIKTTQIYLDTFDNDRIDEANRLITE